MADAYSRITCKPSFTYGQFGPGVVICVAGITDAYWGHSPLICITSSTSSASLYRYHYQGIDDQLSLFAPVTKWNALVPDIARLPDIFILTWYTTSSTSVGIYLVSCQLHLHFYVLFLIRGAIAPVFLIFCYNPICQG